MSVTHDSSDQITCNRHRVRAEMAAHIVVGELLVRELERLGQIHAVREVL